MRVEDIMTVAQMAEFLHISSDTAYELVHSRGFPAFRVGRKILVTREKLMEWIAKREKEGI